MGLPSRCLFAEENTKTKVRDKDAKRESDLHIGCSGSVLVLKPVSGFGRLF